MSKSKLKKVKIMEETNNKHNIQHVETEEDPRKEIINNNLLKIGAQIPEKEKSKVSNSLLTMFQKGIPLGEAAGFSESDLTQIYRFAYSQFYAGQYALALELFKVLFKLKPGLNEVATSIGVCHHRLGNYELAAAAYLVSGTMNENDPMPYFYAYDCYNHLELPLKATLMIINVITKCGDQPMYKKLKEKAQIILDGINKDQPST